MPLSLQRKLLTPTEVMVRNEAAPHCGGKALPIHALRFAPEGDGPLQPLLWLHGGPMCQLSFDYNPLLSWLASCGYLWRKADEDSMPILGTVVAKGKSSLPRDVGTLPPPKLETS